MFTIIFFIALIWITVKLFVLGIKLTWGIAKCVCMVMLFPLFLLVMVMIGALYVAIPVLIIAGLIAVVGNLTAT